MDATKRAMKIRNSVFCTPVQKRVLEEIVEYLFSDYFQILRINMCKKNCIDLPVDFHKV